MTLKLSKLPFPRQTLILFRVLTDTQHPIPNYLRSLILVTMLAIATATVYATGGAGFAYPYLMMLPIVLSAVWFGTRGALLNALAAGLLIGPLMPQEVVTGTAQSTGNWLARTLLFVIIGGYAGMLLKRANRTKDELLEAMSTDPRTGLPNQGALDTELAHALLKQKTLSDPTLRPLAIIMVRFTDLPEILEAMGTNAADELVGAIARRLRNDLKSVIGVYRFSGSEIVLLTRAVSTEQLSTAVDGIADVGEEMWELQGVPVRVQMAAGSSVSQPGATDGQEMIRQARTALLAAIDRSQFYFPYDATHERSSVDHVVLISRLRKALRSRELSMFYQPKINLQTGEVAGCEALIRWHEPDGSLISPALFMPKVEKTTLIGPVTRFVLSQACEFMSQHPDQTISINFAVRNLYDKGLLFDLPLILEQANISPHNVEIEITERALVDKPDVAHAIIRELRGLGMQVSIDDFGTGYSSFAYLKHLPLNGLKIDRTFVKDLEQDQRAQRLMKCLIEVANALDLEVTAEGVETRKQAQILRSMGCHKAQGYFFAYPMALQEYRAWTPGPLDSWITE